MKIVKGFSGEKFSQSKKCVFLHSTLLNKDFSLDIVGKHIKIFTVILESILEGIDVIFSFNLIYSMPKLGK